MPTPQPQQASPTPTDLTDIKYFYDFNSIFANPKQAAMFPSPYGKIQQPTKTPSGMAGGLGNFLRQPIQRPVQQRKRMAEGGLINTTTDDLLRIIGGK